MRAPPRHALARSTIVPPADGSNPLTIDDAALAEGARHYAISCAPCHGAAGYGGGRVSVNLVPWPAPSLRTAAVQAMMPFDLYDVVTSGHGRMPSYAWQLGDRERWEIVAWTSALTARAPHDSAAQADSIEAAMIGRIQERWRQMEAQRGSARPPGRGT
jgi:mono/diheme cytochrome c family protein